MMMESLLRIVFAPGTASELVLLDWNQPGDVPDLEWQQLVQTDDCIGAAWAGILPRGNVRRQWSIKARRLYDTAAEMLYESLDADATLPIGISAALHVRVLDQTQSPAASEATRTLAHYIAATAVILSATPESDPEMLAVDTTYVVQLGALVKQ